ncbi:S9 family peptidase [Paenibacillus sp. BC26]|uniref:alpha/beta hydrolase family protein n=1 Tax=Paenibacillus sp. BC26 TaxID=1881032 RepID=UPI0008E3640F|nr:alpha/beta hydrolase [Paenibacillus sp. BC26]SFS74307.1 Acetyl esterase/lipase [Paenibacillus sp. BC26]
MIQEQLIERTYTYKVVESVNIQADVFRKSDERIRPVIVWIHGGCLMGGSRTNLGKQELMKYVEEGYAVVSIDYRLSPQVMLKSIIEDLQDAFRWVREQGPALFQIDPDRLAVIGSSAGGYLTLMAGFCVEPKPVALVSFFGYGDVAGKWYAEPDDHYCKQPPASREENLYLYCRQNGLWPNIVAGHDPKTEPRAFDPYCPVRNVTEAYPPTLLLHGDNDTDVPHEQSVIMAEEFARVGVAYEFVSYPGAGHGLGANYSDAVNKTVAFLRKYLQ